MLIILLVSLAYCKENSQLGELLRQWEDCITRSDKQAQKYLDLIIQTYVIPREYESRFYRLYGQYILYGLDNQNFIDFPKAYYYLKLSAQPGNTKAQFYLALLENYKLDGTFALMQNLNQTDYREIFSYVKNSHHSNSLVDLYFASTQGNFQASIALGFKHLYGIGMDGNCSNAALYFLPVAEFQSHRRDKFHIEERNLGQLLYDSDFFLSYELNSEEFLEIFQNLGQVTHDSIHQVKQTAYNFYYGLNGVKKDFQKAFQLYQKIAEETNDVGAKVTVAEMILEGLGNNDYKQAFQYLQITDPTSKEVLGRAYNSLGFMYFNGLHVSKSISKAQEYFQKSSEYDNANGHFNLGSLLVLPSTLERERNKKQAIIHFQNAVAHGHPQALYSLGMILLDGVDLFYSCELGATLLHKSVLRNEWAEVLNHAIHLFRSEQYKKSFVRYLEAAFLGHSNGFQNAAVVAQLYNGLYIPSDLYTNVDQRLKNDIVYKIMNHSIDANTFIYSEILNFDNQFNLTAYLDFDQNKYIGWLTFHLYVNCKREKDAFCTIKVADHYYYGEYYERNYNKSYKIYTEALSYNTIPTMRSHIYFNLGIMSALGEGVEQNLTQSKIYFKQSLDEYHVIPAIPQIIILKLIDIFFQVYIKEQSITELIQKSVSFDQIHYQLNEILKSLTSMILVGMIVFLFAYKLRIQNSIK